MKLKKILILLVIIIFVAIGIFIIYKLTYQESFNYVALGDSVAAGRNPYGANDYGYTDYISDYLLKNHHLKNFVNYAVNGYTTNDILEDINYNKQIEVNGKMENIRKALRESDLVTISIGANDLLDNINITNIGNMFSSEAIKRQIDDIFEKIDRVLIEVKKYAKNNIVVVGYYNPLPQLTKYKDIIDEVIEYSNKKYQDLCDKHGIIFVKISDVIAKNNDYLPNPLDIHPSIKGYEAISKRVIERLNQSIFNR